MKSNTRPPISIIASAVLLCLVMASIHMTSGMFARYTTRANSDGAARAAAFAVSAEADTDSPVTVTSDGTDENGIAAYTVKVKNDGETAVSYEATVRFTGDKADKNAEKFDDEKLTFTGTLAPKAEDEKQLTFDMSECFDEDNKYSTFSNDDISGTRGEAPFEMSVVFTQID